MAKLSKKKQQELIDLEVERINKILVKLPDKKKEIAKELIKRIAHMTIQLQILEETVQTKGPTYWMENGRQRMLVENPAQKSYNNTMNRYTSAYEKLFILVDKIEEEHGREQQEADADV
ncbi:hypothetical protein LC087_19410 (plasmid) [Bacillus carboniphilus]|uniref:Phage protein n=1 Tax=Bacillus carboniphilus TaxID=86663 RepID=A0ABY9JYJ8_9BACI|nr:hypothetical protein [Bacillus carboniphilus]WLR44471.1 hypothetical protein LC087_19410 [Bacillus carboniphilus]